MFNPHMHLIRHAIALQLVTAWLRTTTGNAWSQHFLLSPMLGHSPDLLTHLPHVQPCSQPAPQMSASARTAAYGKGYPLPLVAPSTYQCLQAPAAELIREHCCKPAAPTTV